MVKRKLSKNQLKKLHAMSSSGLTSKILKQPDELIVRAEAGFNPLLNIKFGIEAKYIKDKKMRS